MNGINNSYIQSQNANYIPPTNNGIDFHRLHQTEIDAAAAPLSVKDKIIKVVLFPFTLIGLLFKKIFTATACYFGMGSVSEIKVRNAPLRTILREQGGEEVRFGFSGQPVLEGMYFRAENAHPNTKTILLCTGSHRPYEYYAPAMVRALKEMGHHVLIFNYAGYGDSEGNRSEESVYQSIEAAYQFLRQVKGCPDHSIIGWGYSMGSAVIDLATKHPIDIVVDRGFTSMAEVAAELFPWPLSLVPKMIFKVGAHFDNLSRIGKIRGNVFIAEGNQDKMKGFGMNLRDAALKTIPSHQVTYKLVNSAHFHNAEVWFGVNSDDKLAIKNYLNR